MTLTGTQRRYGNYLKRGRHTSWKQNRNPQDRKALGPSENLWGGPRLGPCWVRDGMAAEARGMNLQNLPSTLSSAQRETVKNFEQGSDRIQHMLLKDHCSCFMGKNEWEKRHERRRLGDQSENLFSNSSEWQGMTEVGTWEEWRT